MIDPAATKQSVSRKMASSEFLQDYDNQLVIDSGDSNELLPNREEAGNMSHFDFSFSLGLKGLDIKAKGYNGIQIMALAKGISLLLVVTVVLYKIFNLIEHYLILHSG